MALNLIKTETAPQACDLIERFEDIMADHMSVSRSLYGPERLLCWYVDNEENGSQMRIIFDPENVHAGRQGMHSTLEMDEYDLANKCDEGCDNGFDTLWLHVKF